jgi:hypothetical protein
MWSIPPKRKVDGKCFLCHTTASRILDCQENITKEYCTERKKCGIKRAKTLQWEETRNLNGATQEIE